ncbi:MAG TPA: hypothetical protein VGF55_29560, partial [Gemmataceae bacterium]
LAEPRRGAVIAAEPLPDHRRLYLDFEGQVGGDRGRVVRWDAGTFAWDRDAENELHVRMEGNRLVGTVTLRRADGGWTWEWR